MERIKPGFPTLITEALRLIPAHVHEYIDCDIFTGTDPVFAGLHSYEACSFGRSYRNTAHVAYPYHQVSRPKSDRRVTMVLPTMDTPLTVVHEFGHVLHHRLRFEPNAKPVSWYAETNRYEAFAEAFAAFVLPHHFDAAPDERFVALMASLA